VSFERALDELFVVYHGHGEPHRPA
jgi:hypothetical protein